MLTESLSVLLLSLAGSAVAQSSSALPTGPSPTVLQKCAASMNGQLPNPTPSGYEFSGNVRRYYVASEEVEWNYAPTGWDNWLGVPIEKSPRAQMAGALQYGTTWLKALYRGYTDATFTEYSTQEPWQGTQGPTLRAEVGDLIEIMFVNKVNTYYTSMHSMGLAYTKYSEGADYANTTAGVNTVEPTSEAVPPVDSGVEPGDCVVYKWMVPELAGPNDGLPARVHSYHSYVAMYQDTNAGLIGPSIVYAPGMMNETMANYREITLLYHIYDEAVSWLSGANAAMKGVSGSQASSSTTSYPVAASTGTTHYSGSHATSAATTGTQASSNPAQTTAASSTGSSNQQGNQNTQQYEPTWGWPNMQKRQTYNNETLWDGNVTVWQPQVTNLNGANGFMSAPSFYTMNGYIFANNPTFNMCLNDKVIWYTNAYGSASHVFHLHGNGVEYHREKRYAVSLNDGVGKTLYMNATGQGLWQAICHVNNHHDMGMVSNYQVWPTASCPLAPLPLNSTY